MYLQSLTALCLGSAEAFPLLFKAPQEQLTPCNLGDSEDQRHSLSYELAWRTLADPSHKCSPGVRAQLGGSLKSALRYVLRQETLDDPFFPLSGYSVRYAGDAS